MVVSESLAFPSVSSRQRGWQLLQVSTVKLASDNTVSSCLHGRSRSLPWTEDRGFHGMRPCTSFMREVFVGVLGFLLRR